MWVDQAVIYKKAQVVLMMRRLISAFIYDTHFFSAEIVMLIVSFVPENVCMTSFVTTARSPHWQSILPSELEDQTVWAPPIYDPPEFEEENVWLFDSLHVYLL